ncbi:MAG: general stress protein [Gemmataceae bacterium]|nr:general stress protein [Gemmataceae bacterium]
MAERKKMVTGVFRDPVNAQRAHDSLRRRGYTETEINVLMSDKTRAAHFSDKEQGSMKAGTMATEGMGVGGAIGTAVGASLAAIAAIGTTLAIPLTGGASLLVAGPLAAALAGGGAGAVAGGLVGALVGWGIPEQNAEAYSEALREGGVVIGVHPHNDEASAIKDEFEKLRGENVCYC